MTVMLQLRQADDRVTVHRDWFKDYRFHMIESVDQLKQLVDICVSRKLCSLDVETTGVDSRIYPDEYFDDGKVSRHGVRTVDKIAGLCISFDGLNGYYIPLAHEPEDSGNLPWDEAWDEITRLVRGCKVIFHNIKFDGEMLLPVIGKDYWKLDEHEDTFLCAKVVNPLKSSPAGLKPLTKSNFEVEMVELDELFTIEKKEQLKREKKRYNFAMLHPREGLEYGCSDGIFTYKLWFSLRDRLTPGDQVIYNLEKSFCNVIRELERNRVHVDVDRVNQLYVECKAALESTGNLVRDIVEKNTGSTGKWLRLNIGAPKQLSEAFFTDPEGMRLKPLAVMEEGDQNQGYKDALSDSDDDEDEDEEQKQYSLKDEVMKALHRAYGHKFLVQRSGVIDKKGNPKPESIFELTLEYRHYEKMKGSYVEKLFKSHDKYGDVRPSFNQMGTDTARLSSKAGKIDDGYSGVNFQGIPRDSDEDKPELFKQIRTCIAPRPGWMLVKIDYSGEELRVVTNLSGDPIWIKTFLHGDGDVHSITGRILFGKENINKDERNRAKRCNFAFIYGGGAGAIQRNVECSMEDAQRHMNNLRSGVPVLMGYVDSQKSYALQYKCIYTAYGRRIPIPTINSPIRMIRSKAERCAINYTIQSTSADVLKFAMCNVDKQLRTLGWKERCRYVLTVHDEVVFEIKPEYLMEIIPKLDEWMTLPWKLQKAHGRDWVVPLETEPGVDIHWRARYDFFKMTRGEPADPSKIAEDGNYNGELKKGQVYDAGRIYQVIPDFLKPYIKRNEPSLPAAEVVPPPELPPPTPTPISPLPVTVIPILALQSPEPVLVPEEPKSEPVEEIVTPPQKSNEININLDISLDSPSPSPSPEADLNMTLDSEQDISIGLPSLDIDDVVIPKIVEPPPPSVSQIQEKSSVHPQTHAETSAIVPVPVPVPIQKTNGAGKVLRWALKTVPSKESMRKLHAICILAEGKTPLRIVNLRGDIILPESEGVLVDPDVFRQLASLFGVG